jgi:transcription elongation factor Elf1
MIEFNTNTLTLKPGTSCPNCGSKDLILKTIKETNHQTTYICNVVKCKNCNVAYDSMPYKIEIKENDKCKD